MGAGYRNSFADNIADDIYGEFSGDTSYNMVSPKRHRRKSKRTKSRVKKSPSRNVKRISHKRVKKGKRPYPHWLKKYWFKKKR